MKELAVIGIFIGAVFFGRSFKGSAGKQRLPEETRPLAERTFPSADTEKEYLTPLSLREALDWSPRANALQAVAEYISSVNENEVMTVAEQILTYSQGSVRDISLQILFERWLRMNANDAWTYVKSNSKHLEAMIGRGVIASFIEAWSHLDVRAAINATTELSGNEKSAIRVALSNSLRNTHPKESLILSAEMTNPSYGDIVAATWDRLLNGASGELLKLPSKETLPTEIVMQIVDAVTRLKAKQNPQEAIHWIGSLPDADLRKNALMSLMQTVSSRSPQEARILLESKEQWRQCTDAIKTIAAEWMKQDPETALNWVSESLAGGGRYEVLKGVLEEGMGAQPKRIANMAETSGASSVVAFVDFATIGGRLADENPRLAWEWISNLDIETTANRNGTAKVIAKRLAAEDLNAAMDLINQIPNDSVHPDQLRTGLLAGVSEEIGYSAPQEAERWLAQARSATETGEIASAVMKGMVTSDPLTAADYASNVEDPNVRSQLIQALVSHWSSIEPEQAIQWVTDIGQSELLSPEIVAEAVKGWSEFDPMEASNG